MISKAGFITAASCLLLAACANKPIPTQDVTVSLATVSCDAEFTRSRAKPIGYDPEEPVTLDFEVQRTSPCKLDSDGNKQLYEVISLPNSAVPYLVTVASPKIGGSAFAPTAVTLDKDEQVRRVFDHDAFLNRGSRLMAMFEAEPEDRFLVISSNAGVAGDVKSEIQTVISSQSHYNAAYATSSTLYFGSEQQRGYTMSHTGKVSVTTQAAPDRSLTQPNNRSTTTKP
ncbi:MAG: hypothetical protein HEP70_04285 [Rhodobiaceae bacterium]|nr:hypothetical protein [Rhodobiaceae bacterium]